jgi:hypothetical protein
MLIFLVCPGKIDRVVLDINPYTTA